MIKEDSFAPFRAKGNQNVYRLSVALVNKSKKTVEIKEYVEDFGGEVGKRYAKNLLFRMGNEAVQGTEFENIPWEEMKGNGTGPLSKIEFGFIKTKENGSYLLAMAAWAAKRI